MNHRDYILVLVGFVLGLALSVAMYTPAQDVKYCRNAETGEIIVVEAGMPCPYPTHEL